MDGAQDWCLQCGAGAPDSLAASTPSWRSAAAVLGAIAVLVAGAATAAYAALSKSSPKPPRATSNAGALAQVPASTTPAAPATTTPPSALPPTSAKIGTPTTVKPLIPLSKPPKIPLAAITLPKASTPKTPPASTTPTTSTTPATTGTGGSGAKSEQPEAILLDTNAAATYNPSNYPTTNFGDPSLAIDGDTSTAWTALVDPAVAPKMADGLVIDLKSAQKVSALVLDTSTPGMTVQVNGSNAATLPASITDPAWTQLSGLVLEKKKHVRIPLRDSTKAFRFVLLWISKVPAASVGTAAAPGHVAISEIALFPTKK
jgi:hypothetical protein